MVRCGQCKIIFNAMLYLVDDACDYTAGSNDEHIGGVMTVTTSPATSAHGDPSRMSKSALDVIRSKSEATVNWLKQAPKRFRINNLEDGESEHSWKNRFSNLSEKLAYRLAEFHRSLIHDEQQQTGGGMQALQSPGQHGRHIHTRQIKPTNQGFDPVQLDQEFHFQTDAVRGDQLLHPELQQTPPPPPDQLLHPEIQREPKMPPPDMRRRLKPPVDAGGMPEELLRKKQREQRIQNQPPTEVDPLDQLKIFDDMDDSQFEENLWLEYFANDNQQPENKDDTREQGQELGHRTPPVPHPRPKPEPVQAPSNQQQYQKPQAQQDPGSAIDFEMQSAFDEPFPNAPALAPYGYRRHSDMQPMQDSLPTSINTSPSQPWQTGQTDIYNGHFTLESDGSTYAPVQSMDTDTAHSPAQSLDTLRELYENEQNPFLRSAAVRGLNDQLILAEIALNDNTSMVRIAALENLTDPDLLLEILESDPSPEVQKAAIEKLKMIQPYQR